MIAKSTTQVFNADSSSTLTASSFDEAIVALTIVQGLSERTITGIALEPLEMRHLGEWLLERSREHLVDCHLCKKPIRRDAAKMLGQDLICGDCMDRKVRR